MSAFDRLVRRFRKGLEVVVDAMKAEFIAQGHNASGETIKSFEVRIKKDFEDLIGEIWVAKHAVFTDSGTRPHRPPFKAIFEWSKHVMPGLSEKERRSFSFAVINKISKEGTPTRGSYSFSQNGRRKEFSKHAVDSAQQEFEEKLDYLQFLIELGDEALRPKAA